MENGERMEKDGGTCGTKKKEESWRLRERGESEEDCASGRREWKKHRRMEKDGGGVGNINNNNIRGRKATGYNNNQEGTTRSKRYQSFGSSKKDGSQRTVDEKEKQRCTIFVGDLDSATTPHDLTSLFEKFGKVLSSKIKDGLCYGFVTFDTRECAEAAVAAGQREGGITLPNNNTKQIHVSWALGALPDWKKGIGGFVISPSKSQPHPRSRKGVVKSSVLAAATAAAAAKAHSVLAGVDIPPPTLDQAVFRGREIVAYDDLL